MSIALLTLACSSATVVVLGRARNLVMTHIALSQISLGSLRMAALWPDS